MTDPKGLPPIGDPLAALCSQLARDLAAAMERIKALEGENARVTAANAGFCMDYRMKCDEETKRLHVALERAEAEVARVSQENGNLAQQYAKLKAENALDQG
jgi:hypothetical protein